MKVRKCKNTVFCIIFFASVLVGTICGVLLFLLLANTKLTWLTGYVGRVLEMDTSFHLADFLFQIRPLLFAIFCFCLPGANRYFPIYITVRCSVISYSAACYLYSGYSYGPVLIRCICTLPVLFLSGRVLFQLRHKVINTKL